jgi:hypothetical protein
MPFGQADQTQLSDQQSRPSRRWCASVARLTLYQARKALAGARCGNKASINQYIDVDLQAILPSRNRARSMAAGHGIAVRGKVVQV